MAIVKSKFVPAMGFSNAHLQTMLPSILPEHDLLKPISRERLTLPDGDFVDFDWFAEKSDAPIVIILHGMTGSIDSHYVQSVLKQLKARGWRPVLMYYRGCSGEPNLLNSSYHVGDCIGLNTLVTELRGREPETPIAAVGYSLGANVLLKWLGESEASKELSTAIAVSVPFDLIATANRLREGISRFYQWWLIGELHDYVRRKYQQKAPPFDFGDVTHLKSFWEFDDAITAPLNGFINATEYYEKNSCKQFLPAIQIPTLIIHSKDDPFMTPVVIPTQKELAKDTVLELSDHGGHVGFVSGNPFALTLKLWLEERIPQHLDQYLKVIQRPIHVPLDHHDRGAGVTGLPPAIAA